MISYWVFKMCQISQKIHVRVRAEHPTLCITVISEMMADGWRKHEKLTEFSQARGLNVNVLCEA